MTQDKRFWLAIQAGLAVFYAWAVFNAATQGFMHRSVLIALVILAAHVLEIPVAFKKLKALNPDPVRVSICTILFGLVWWIPASRGLIAVR